MISSKKGITGLIIILLLCVVLTPAIPVRAQQNWPTAPDWVHIADDYYPDDDNPTPSSPKIPDSSVNVTSFYTAHNMSHIYFRLELEGTYESTCFYGTWADTDLDCDWDYEIYVTGSPGSPGMVNLIYDSNDDVNNDNNTAWFGAFNSPVAPLKNTDAIVLAGDAASGGDAVEWTVQLEDMGVEFCHDIMLSSGWADPPPPKLPHDGGVSPGDDMIPADQDHESPEVGHGKWLFGLHNPIGAEYDVAATSQTPDPDTVVSGEQADINVTVWNYGNVPTIFDVECYYNDGLIDHLIGNQTLNLTAGNSSTITFTWNTTGMTTGTYTIKAIADPDDTISETNEVNNECTNPASVTINNLYLRSFSETLSMTSDNFKAADLTRSISEILSFEETISRARFSARTILISLTDNLILSDEASRTATIFRSLSEFLSFGGFDPQNLNVILEKVTELLPVGGYISAVRQLELVLWIAPVIIISISLFFLYRMETTKKQNQKS